MKLNKFQKLVRYINSFKEGDVITRKMLSEKFGRKEKYREKYHLEETYDLYRVRLCRLGYLDHIARGEYQKIKDIPEDMTVSDSLIGVYKNKRLKLKDHGKTEENK